MNQKQTVCIPSTEFTRKQNLQSSLSKLQLVRAKEERRNQGEKNNTGEKLPELS